MRNLVLAKKVVSARKLTPVFAVAYADAPGLPMADKIGSEAWDKLNKALRPEAKIHTISLHRVVEMASGADGLDRSDSAQLKDLADWISEKIQHVASETSHTHEDQP